MSFQTIELTVADHLARLTLRRPQSANAINPVMAEELWLATIVCEESPDIRAVLITGEGRFFSAGGDLGSFAGVGPAIGEQLAKMTCFIHGAFSKLARMTAPVVIAVNGTAAGAGLSLALLGDIVVAAKSATFTSGYTAAGLTPDGGSTYLLPRLVGYRRAQEMVLCNRRVDADEALHGVWSRPSWRMISCLRTPNKSRAISSKGRCRQSAERDTCSWQAPGTSTKPRWNARRERSSRRPKVLRAKKASPPSSRSAGRTS